MANAKYVEHVDRLAATTRHPQEASVHAKRRIIKLDRTWELETLYDFATLLAEGIAAQKIAQEWLPDSRSRMDVMLNWANEFNETYAWTDWSDFDYLETLGKWFKLNVEKLRITALATALEAGTGEYGS